MKLFKLTNENMSTYLGCQWEIGKAKTTNGNGKLCGPGWLHAYESPLLAVLHNPVHAGYQNPRLFEAESSGRIKKDGQMKCGVTRLTLVKEIKIPEVTIIQRIAYGILCAKEVCKDKSWNKWANNWLNGKDRSALAARAAWEATRAAEVAEVEAEAGWAAKAAAESARIAGAAMWAAGAVESTRTAIWTATAAHVAALAATTHDAAEAAEAAGSIDLVKIAKAAMKVK
jgi:hypothetical protein